jgi:hypothetical protein
MTTRVRHMASFFVTRPEAVPRASETNICAYPERAAAVPRAFPNTSVHLDSGRFNRTSGRL